MDHLDKIAKVAVDMMSKGADEVSISGYGIKLVSRKSLPTVGSGTSNNYQVVSVHSNAVANASNVTAHFSIVRQSLRDIYGEDRRLSDLEKKLTEIEKEIKKRRPDKNKLKSFLQWLTDFGLEAFTKVAPIIIDKLNSLGL
jgi:hypothetical protein